MEEYIIPSIVKFKNPIGTTYLHSNITYWDKESKYCRHKR